MRLATLLRYLYLSYFSKPAGERVLYRTLRRTRAKKILEIGIGTTDRTLRMLRLACRLVEGEAVSYAAIDLFEARGADPGAKLSLKEVHRLLKSTDVQARLIPGEPAQALAQAANSLPNVDVVLIAACQSEASLAEAWFYVPRMLHPGSVVYLETRDAATGSTTLRVLSASEIQSLAASGRRRRAA